MTTVNDSSTEANPPELEKSDKPARRSRKPVTVTNVTGDGKPNMLPLDGDSEVAEAYRRHLDKPLVKASEREAVAEQVVLFLAICREQGIAFDYSAKGVDLHHAATGALFFNHAGHEVVTPKGREALIRALSRATDVRNLSVMLININRTLADAPRTEREEASQSKVDLAQLITSLAGKSNSPEELAAALLKLIK